MSSTEKENKGEVKLKEDIPVSVSNRLMANLYNIMCNQLVIASLYFQSPILSKG